MTIGQHLAHLAKLRRKTQRQLAAECAMSRVTINRFFNGRTDVGIESAARIMLALGIDLPQALADALSDALKGGDDALHK